MWHWWLWRWIHRDEDVRIPSWQGASSWRRDYESQTLVVVMPFHIVHATLGRFWFWWRYPIGSGICQMAISNAYHRGYVDGLKKMLVENDELKQQLRKHLFCPYPHANDSEMVATFTFLQCGKDDPKEGNIEYDQKKNEWRIFCGEKWKPLIKFLCDDSMVSFNGLFEVKYI